MRQRPRVNIPGFVYECRTPPEAVEAAKEWLESEETNKRVSKDAPGRSFHSLGNWAMFDDKGEKTREQYNWACHATLTAFAAQNESCVALYCRAQSHEDWRDFIGWLAEDSFATDFVLAKTNNGIVVSADIPAGLLFAIAMISRAPRMFSKGVFETYNKAVASGVSPEVAYMVIMNSNCGDNDNAIWYPCINHKAWHCPSLEGMKMFCRGEFKVRAEDLGLFREHRTQYCSHFIPKGQPRGLILDLLKDTEFKEALAELRGESKEEVYKPPNPFARDTSSQMKYGDVTRKEMIEFVLPYATKKGMFDV